MLSVNAPCIVSRVKGRLRRVPLQELFAGHARVMEAQKRWQFAESAWVAAGEPAQAVAMHRRNGDLAAMFRAVAQHQPVCQQTI